MQDFGTKADNSPPPGGQLSAAEFNNLATENENAVLRSGLALSGASDTQLAESMFLHSVKSESFQDSGVANAYVATPVSGSGGVLLPGAYTNLGGASISFKASAANSGASTLNIGQTTGTLLGTKAIRTQADTEISANAIGAGQYIQLVYVPSFDSGNGAWVLLPWSSAVSQPPSALHAKSYLSAANASTTITADSVTLNTALGGVVYQINAFSKVINISTVGVGGMDTGAAPASGYVAIYAIYNPNAAISGTNPSLLATNATAAVQPEIYGGGSMPAGYTASALMAVWPTTAGSLLAVGLLSDRRFSRPAVSVLNTAVGTGVLTTLSVASAIPLNARSCRGFVNITSAAGSNNNAFISADSLSTGYQYTSQGPGTGLAGNWDIDLVTAQTIFYMMNVTAAPGVFIIQISSYGF